MSAALVEAARVALRELDGIKAQNMGAHVYRAREDLRAALAAAEQPAEPVHWLAVLDAEQRPHQLKTGLHDVGFHKKRSAEEFIASELTFNGWVYTLQPLFAAAPAQPTPPAAPAQLLTINYFRVAEIAQTRKLDYNALCAALRDYLEIAQ